MIGNDRKYPDAVYAAVSKHELGDTLTRRQIEAVLDAAGSLVVALPDPDDSPRLSGAPMWTLSEDVEVWVGSQPSPFVAATGCEDMWPEEAERFALAVLAAARAAKAAVDHADAERAR